MEGSPVGEELLTAVRSVVLVVVLGVEETVGNPEGGAERVGATEVDGKPVGYMEVVGVSKIEGATEGAVVVLL